MVVFSVFQHGKLIISAFSGTGMMLCNKHIRWCNLQLLHTTLLEVYFYGLFLSARYSTQSRLT